MAPYVSVDGDDEWGFQRGAPGWNVDVAIHRSAEHVTLLKSGQKPCEEPLIETLDTAMEPGYCWRPRINPDKLFGPTLGSIPRHPLLQEYRCLPAPPFPARTCARC